MNEILKDKNGNTSSKRITGVSLVAYVMVMCTLSMVFHYEINASTLTLLNTMLYSGCGLLGVSVFETKK